MAFEVIREVVSDSVIGRVASSVVGVLVVIILALGIWWSIEPDQFSVKENAAQMAAEINKPVVVGTATTAALIKVADTILHKRGGYLSNDIMPPGVYLDNIPNWEYGALVQVRDLSRAMRESLSRSQSQSKEDPDLTEAEPRFNFDNSSWAIPASESQYEEGIAYLRSYLKRLSDKDNPDAQFYARADNLRGWLESVQARMGSLSQRLAASVGQKRVNTDLAGDSAASQSTEAPDQIEVKTPFFELDDIFYEARGTTWALIHFLKAIEIDFKDVLEKKNALVSLRQIIRELESTQETLWSPMILNGGGFGLWANHSLVMASYISKANAAIIDLRELLSKG